MPYYFRSLNTKNMLQVKRDGWDDKSSVEVLKWRKLKKDSQWFQRVKNKSSFQPKKYLKQIFLKPFLQLLHWCCSTSKLNQTVKKRNHINIEILNKSSELKSMYFFLYFFFSFKKFIELTLWSAIIISYHAIHTFC